MKCAKCNAEIPDSSKFCPQCAEPQTTPMIAPPPRVVDSGVEIGGMKMFLIGLAVAGIAFLVWNDVPGFRYAAPHHLLSPVDMWTVPTNPRIPTLPCQDDLYPEASWRARADGLCHAEDAPGPVKGTFAAPPQPPPPQPHTMTVTDNALTVNANAYSSYKFTVPPGVRTVSLPAISRLQAGPAMTSSFSLWMKMVS